MPRFDSGCFEHESRARRLVGIVFLAAMGAGLPAFATAPPTRVDVVTDTLHGVPIADPYRWLEDQNSPETRAWIAAQNAYTSSLIAGLPGRDKLEARLTELLRADRVGIPTKRGGRYFFSKRLADQDQYVLYLREGLHGPDQVLIDPHPLSPDHTVSVGLSDVSPDGKVIAYTLKQGGADENVVRLYDVDGRRQLGDSLPLAVYSGFSFTHDLGGFYYTRRLDDGSSRVYYHPMGDDPAQDSLVFGSEYGPEIMISSWISDNGRWLFIGVYHGWTKTDLFVQDLTRKGPIVPLVTGIAATFSPTDAGDSIFLVTDWEAPNRRVLLVDLQRPHRENWREVIPAGASVIDGATSVGGNLCVNYLENVQSKVRIFTPGGEFIREIAFPVIGSVSGVYGRWGDREAFFSFSSFAVPSTIYRYDVVADTREVWADVNVPVDPDAFVLSQQWYTSKDGTRVPIFVMYRKGLARSGTNPALLYGYGGFNVSKTPEFNIRAVVWAEQGGVYAMPSLRGGGEFGEAWHRAAMFEKKQNTFDDFIAAAEYLTAEKYTSSEKLSVFGGSNGGLLVGAALTQRPDLFGAVLYTYPLLDMLRFHKFLMGPYWVAEYGSADDPKQFDYLRKYSPYHNVRRGATYPAVMFVTGDSDTRVDPLHARKMTALLQEVTGSATPVLLHYDTQAGHSGGTPVRKQVADYADELHFLLRQLGVTPK